MNKTSLVGALSVASLAFTALEKPTFAAVINFDDQGFSGPSQFDLAGDAQTLSINTDVGSVTFTGGVILTNATNLPANRSATYGTANNIRGIRDNFTRQNPLVIEFENPVENFFLDVFNGVPIPSLNYTVADDIGNSSTFSLESNARGGFQKIGFQATGQRITITPDTSAAALEPRFSKGAYDFLIDNVTFNTSLPDDLLDPIDEVVVPMPEPPLDPSPVPVEEPSPVEEPEEPEEPSPVEEPQTPEPMPMPTSPSTPDTPIEPTPLPGPDPTSVPEPTGVLSLLAVGAFGLYKKSKKESL